MLFFSIVFANGIALYQNNIIVIDISKYFCKCIRIYTVIITHNEANR